ncbi:hypothetical protein GCM10029964_093230 [Kibdelosporangium lantanae]
MAASVQVDPLHAVDTSASGGPEPVTVAGHRATSTHTPGSPEVCTVAVVVGDVAVPLSAAALPRAQVLTTRARSCALATAAAEGALAAIPAPTAAGASGTPDLGEDQDLRRAHRAVTQLGDFYGQ